MPQATTETSHPTAHDADKPLRDLQMMGCDRGGGDDQNMNFFGSNFGSCSTMDPCLCAAMPTQLAYYCPGYCRPYCGGQCYSLTERDDCLDGIIRDVRGGRWNFLEDERFWNVEVETWGYGTGKPIWPANFGSPSCAYDYSGVFSNGKVSSNNNNPPTRAPTKSKWEPPTKAPTYSIVFNNDPPTREPTRSAPPTKDEGSLFDTLNDSTLLDTLKDAKDTVLETASSNPSEWSPGQIAGITIGAFFGMIICCFIGWSAAGRSKSKK